MAFDLATATPVSSGFDLSTAQPLNTSGVPGFRQTPGVGSYLAAIAEVPAALVSGAASGLVSAPYGIVKQALQGKARYGTPEAVREAEAEAAKFAQEYTYAPRSEVGQQAVGAIGKALQESGAAGVPPNLLTPLGAMSGAAKAQVMTSAPVQRAIQEAGLVKSDITAPFQPWLRERAENAGAGGRDR